MLQAGEPMLVQAFVPKPPVEALDVGVLGGLARLNQDVLNASCVESRAKLSQASRPKLSH